MIQKRMIPHSFRLWLLSGVISMSAEEFPAAEAVELSLRLLMILNVLLFLNQNPVGSFLVVQNVLPELLSAISRPVKECGAQISMETLHFFIQFQNGSRRMAEAGWFSRSGSINPRSKQTHFLIFVRQKASPLMSAPTLSKVQESDPVIPHSRKAIGE
jgi:hypothetical protein